MQKNNGDTEPFEDGELSEEELDGVDGGIGSIHDAVKGRLDSLNEMGETESLRLQMTMDNRSKFMQTLSNANQKIIQTSDSITTNIK